MRLSAVSPAHQMADGGRGAEGGLMKRRGGAAAHNGQAMKTDEEWDSP